MTEKISDERIMQLIAYAEQEDEEWLCEEVVDALWELLKFRNPQPDTSEGADAK